ncbi:winged helix-turn-helix transcriptional regulator [Streptomyces sp. SudanB52_2052]|uniref:winged helix-turn-helix transcriptional regulator n=1 Tax=Streptomyces sp. SudanB52_2052 TaxID=3035276 RepID=UPI003F5644FE
MILASPSAAFPGSSPSSTGRGPPRSRELLKGSHRFNQLREALPGISPHTLTSRLRQFERHGIVTRTTYAEIPPRVEYALTPLGEGLLEVLEAMGTWAMAVPDPEPGVTA